MEVFTRSVVLPLQEKGLEYQWYVFFVPMHACGFLLSNLEHGVKCTGVHAPVWGLVALLRPIRYIRQHV